MRLDTISQFSADTIGIAIIEGNTPTDADGDVVTLTIVRSESGGGTTTVVTDAAATHDTTGDPGFYFYNLTLATTQQKAIYTVTWSWQIAAEDRVFAYEFEIVDRQQWFDQLDATGKQMVDNVYHKVSDGFDSTRGGPYLWELPQSRFNFDTVARLMMIDAMTYINYSSPKAFIPPFDIGVNAQRPFPGNWYGLLEKATAYELFKHLATSYLEIPDPVGVDVARLDRQSYYTRWMQRADHERDELDHMLKMLKRDMRFGTKSRSLLVAGGIFPVSYLNPARPRWPYVLSRFY